MDHSLNDQVKITSPFIRTRLAPTPSGFLHVGNVLSFSLTAWLAQKTGACVLLRIDDLDRQRSDALYLQDIFDTLRFLEIPWNEGPTDVGTFEDHYSQVNRLERYQKALSILIEKKAIFACTCSRGLLAKNGGCNCKKRGIPLGAENVNWRVDTSDIGKVKVKNIDGSVISCGLPPGMADFVVRKKDGLPSYQLTSVVDDLFFNVDLIVRGQDLWPSTLAQRALAALLNERHFGDIAFLHHPLLTEPPGDKISKSAGATSIKNLRERGKTNVEIFESIGQMLRNMPVTRNWQQLGEAVACGGL